MLTTITQIYVSTIGLAFLSGLFTFRRSRPLHLNVFAILVGIYFLVEVYSFLSIESNTSNHWLYNLIVLIGFSTYLWFYFRIINAKRLKKIIAILLVLFPLLWLIAIFGGKGIKTFNTWIYIYGCYVTVFLCFSYYYELLNAKELVKLSTHPEFWITNGLLIYYAASLPFFGLINYLSIPKHIIKSLMVNAQEITRSADALMYLLFTYAFLCQIRIPTRKS